LTAACCSCAGALGRPPLVAVRWVPCAGCASHCTNVVAAASAVALWLKTVTTPMPMFGGRMSRRAGRQQGHPEVALGRGELPDRPLAVDDHRYVVGGEGRGAVVAARLGEAGGGAAWSLRTRSTQVVRACTPAGLSKAVLVAAEFRNCPPLAHSRLSQS
jgi:hypothetical protein